MESFNLDKSSTRLTLLTHVYLHHIRTDCESARLWTPTQVLDTEISPFASDRKWLKYKWYRNENLGFLRHDTGSTRNPKTCREIRWDVLWILGRADNHLEERNKPASSKVFRFFLLTAYLEDSFQVSSRGRFIWRCSWVGKRLRTRYDECWNFERIWRTDFSLSRTYRYTAELSF